MMNLNVKHGVEEAKKMMGKDLFCPADYERAKWDWEMQTPAWAALKKYADEIGLVAEKVAFEWHSDGSMLAQLGGIEEGTIFYHTMYRFQ